MALPWHRVAPSPIASPPPSRGSMAPWRNSSACGTSCGGRVLAAAVEGRLVPNEVDLAREQGVPFESGHDLVEGTAVPPRPKRYGARSREVIAGHAALSVGDTGVALPSGWTRAALVDVARLASGDTPSRRRPEWWGGDVPWIASADARDHHGRVIHATAENTNADGLANSAARLLPAGTVCLSKAAPIGWVTVMGRPMATSQGFANWTCTRALEPLWLRVVFMADRQALVRFAKEPDPRTIRLPELHALHVAVPPLAEQRRIVSEVDRRLSALDSVDDVVDAALARCARLRQSIAAPTSPPETDPTHDARLADFVARFQPRTTDERELAEDLRRALERIEGALARLEPGE